MNLSNCDSMRTEKDCRVGEPCEINATAFSSLKICLLVSQGQSVTAWALLSISAFSCMEMTTPKLITANITISISAQLDYHSPINAL